MVACCTFGNQAASTFAAWVNGEQVGSTAYLEVTPPDGNMSFGNFASRNQAVFQYSGNIDEALIHNVAVDETYLQGRAALILFCDTGDFRNISSDSNSLTITTVSN